MTRIVCGLVLMAVATLVRPLQADEWPEWRGAGRLGLLTESGLVDTSPADGLTVAWRAPIHSGYPGPAVADGRVFVTDARRPDPRSTAVVERALALDEQTGAVLWTQEWETDYAGLQLVYAIGPRSGNLRVGTVTWLQYRVATIQRDGGRKEAAGWVEVV